MLQPLHALSSAVKANLCHYGLEGFKVLRECCGAIGIHDFSGLPNDLDELSGYVTGEGDTVLLYL